MYIEGKEEIKRELNRMMTDMKIHGIIMLIQDVANMNYADIPSEKIKQYKKLYMLAEELKWALFDEVNTDEDFKKEEDE